MKKYWFQTSKKIYLPGLDAFRGMAAFLVFLFHFWGVYLSQKEGEHFTYFNVNFSAPFTAGHIGVDMFFVLSGLLLFLSFGRIPKIQKDKVNFWQMTKSFLSRRFWRLVPLAWIFTLAVFILKGSSYWLSAEGIKNLFYHLFFIQSLSPDTYWELNPVMWTLTVEMLFIFLLPILLFLGRKKRWHFIFILFILILANFAYRIWIFEKFPEIEIKNINFEHDLKIFYSEQIWGRFDQFALGVLFGIFWISDLSKKRLSILAPFALFLGLPGFISSMAIFAILGSNFRDSLFLQTFLHFFTAYFFILIIAGYLLYAENKKREDSKLLKILSPDTFAYFSHISFAFFLWHFPVLSVIRNYIENPLPGFLISFIISLLASIFTLYFIEKPAYGLKNILFKR